MNTINKIVHKLNKIETYLKIQFKKDDSVKIPLRAQYDYTGISNIDVLRHIDYINFGPEKRFYDSDFFNGRETDLKLGSLFVFEYFLQHKVNVVRLLSNFENKILWYLFRNSDNTYWIVRVNKNPSKHHVYFKQHTRLQIKGKLFPSKSGDNIFNFETIDEIYNDPEIPDKIKPNIKESNKFKQSNQAENKKLAMTFK